MAQSKSNTKLNNTNGKRTAGKQGAQVRKGNSKNTQSESRNSRRNTSKAADVRNTNTNTKRNQRSIPAPEPEEEFIPALSMPAAIIIGLLFGLFLELSNFDVFGKLGGWIKYGQFGLFGVMAYVFPVAILLAFMCSALEEKRTLYFVCGMVVFIFLCAFAHLISNVSLDNRNIVSYFTIGADNLVGGGILGGAVALGLYMLLSKTGAIIISIAIMLVCLFVIARKPVMSIINDLFYRDDYDDYDDYTEEEYSTDYDNPKTVTEQSGRLAAPQRITRISENEPIYISDGNDDEEEGTVIRIVRTTHKHGRVHTTQLTRTNKRAQPLRDGNTKTVRSDKKERGINPNVAMSPQSVNSDELTEITNLARSAKELKKPRKIVISGVEVNEKQRVPVGENEAAITNVKEAAVNRRAREMQPVKVQKQDEKPEEQPKTGEKPKTVKVKTVPAVEQEYSDEGYIAPPLSLLDKPKGRSKASMDELERTAQNLEDILAQFGVTATVTDIQAGPSVTRYELQPELGTRVSKITSLADDLKLNLGVTEIRIEAPIPGRQAVGIELPNKNRETVFMRELLEESTLISHPSKIAFAAGKDISGNVVVSDIAKMPHILVAGTTGSGKSVFLNTILMTILYRAKPSEVGLIIIDPKQVEFANYSGIPHLMKDVVTDPGQAVSTLRWAVNEMTCRYQRMQLSAVREFKSYNAKFDKGEINPSEENPRRMNQIVIIIDELADLMMVAKKEAESLICRLAQLARAAGIHIIIATQRPSVDVVTGLIKANIPARVALLVSSQIDSRTIIDMPGAEKLLGYGDMLFYPTGYVKPVRIQGAFVTDQEILNTVEFLRKNNASNYFAAEANEIEKFMSSRGDETSESGEAESGSKSKKYDEFFYEAGKMCIEMNKASSSSLQRRFNLGFNRAARIIDQLEEFGVVGPQNGSKPREILVDLMTFEEMYESMEEE